MFKSKRNESENVKWKLRDILKLLVKRKPLILN